MNQCRIDGCTRPAWCRGLCNPHYQRAQRNGTLEQLAAPSAKVRHEDAPRPFVVEADPELIPATRRRIKAGLCARPGCETHVTDKRQRLCLACRERWKYCPRCERVKPHAEFMVAMGQPFDLGSYCRPCDQTRKGRPATLSGPVRRRATALAELEQWGKRIARLRAAGMSWREVTAVTGLTAAAAQRRYYRWEASARKAEQ